MNKWYSWLLASVLFSGTVYAADMQLETDMQPAINMGMSEDLMNHDHKMHQHKIIDVSGFNKIPALKIKLLKDQSSGWNLQLSPVNFRFAPERVNQANIEGEGHAHLYIDGEKKARLYGNWFHIGSLGKGMHHIRVTLNANDHSELGVGLEPIEAVAVVTE